MYYAGTLMINIQ